MNILIVEDDSHKSEELTSLVLQAYPTAAIDIDSSVATAIRRIQGRQFDLVILDMSLPSHSIVPGGGSPISLLNGGLEVLFELDSMGRDDPCLVVTQYPEIEICGSFYRVSDAAKAIKDNYECKVVECIQYGDTETDWRAQFQKILKRYANPAA